MSEANRVALRYVEEDVTYGVTPVDSANWQAVRFTSVSLGANPQTVVSNEIKSNRMVTDIAKVGEAVSGEIGFEFSNSPAMQDLMEAALMGTWAGAGPFTLNAGTIERGFSVELEYEDIASPNMLQFKGMRVGGFTLNVAYGSIVTGSFQLAGKEAVSATGTSLVGSGSIAAAGTEPVMQGSSGVAVINIDGGALTTVKSIALTLSNGLRPIEAVGAAGPSDQAAGRSMLSGTVEMYFEDAAQYTKLVNSTAASLEFTLSDGTDSWNFNISHLKWTDGNPSVTGIDTDVMLSLGFTAFDGNDDGTQITITRTEA